jgi:hypothetical protein
MAARSGDGGRPRGRGGGARPWIARALPPKWTESGARKAERSIPDARFQWLESTPCDGTPVCSVRGVPLWATLVARIARRAAALAGALVFPTRCAKPWSPPRAGLGCHWNGTRASSGVEGGAGSRMPRCCIHRRAHASPRSTRRGPELARVAAPHPHLGRCLPATAWSPPDVPRWVMADAVAERMGPRSTPRWRSSEAGGVFTDWRGQRGFERRLRARDQRRALAVEVRAWLGGRPREAVGGTPRRLESGDDQTSKRLDFA